jgi:hypothetical protein
MAESKLFRYVNDRWRCGHLTLCNDNINMDTNKALVITVSKEIIGGAKVLTRVYGDVGYNCVGFRYYLNEEEVELNYSIILELGDFDRLYILLEQAN